MRNCAICGEPTKFDSYDLCEECFDTPIEELEEKYERKRASATREDQREAPTGRTLATLSS